MTDFEAEDLVSSADIARLADATPQAISNWRTRHEDFPSPVAGTAKRPLFVYGQVLEWLQRMGKLAEIQSPENDELGRLIRAISPRTTPIELFAANAFAIALLKISREIEAGNVAAIEGLSGNEAILKGAARDGIAEIANGATSLTLFEQILVDSNGQFGHHFRFVTNSESWLATRTELVRYFSNSKDLQNSYFRFVAAFDVRFPKESFATSTPVELSESISAQMGKLKKPVESIIDICAGVGNTLFALTKNVASNCRVVAIEVDEALCGVIAARAAIEGVKVEIVSGDVVETLTNRTEFEAGFEFVFCDPPLANSFANAQVELLNGTGIRTIGGETSELIWMEISRWLVSEFGVGLVLVGENALGSQAGSDVSARVHLLQSHQVHGVLELPAGIFPGVSPNRTWYLVGLTGVSWVDSGLVRFVTHNLGLTGPSISSRESIDFGLQSLLEPAGFDDEQFSHSVPISEIIAERGQMINRFFYSYDVAEELAEEVRPAEAWEQFIEILAENNDIADLVFSTGGESETMRIDEAVKNKMLKVYSGRSLAAKSGDAATGIIHVGKSSVISGDIRRSLEYSTPSNSTFLLKTGDVLLTTVDKRIETLVWSGSSEAAPGVGVTVIRVTSPSVNPTHLAWSLRGRSNVSLLGDDGRLRFGALDRFEFSIPPIASQNKVAEKLESIERIQSALRDSLLELSELRQKISTNLALGGLQVDIVPKMSAKDALNVFDISPEE
jgi:16S rRNA G966 N2-methylase RsmD